MKFPMLDEIVKKSLYFFVKNPPPTFDVSKYSLPFVVGSGNGFNTGKILFSKQAAIYADESQFKTMVTSYKPAIDKGLITDVVVISASGEKDSIWEVELAKQLQLKTTLLTCRSNSSAATIADDVYTYKSIAEPYTYNTSTYLGMILSGTGERAQDILAFIEHLTFPKDLSVYEAYAFILADAYMQIAPMIEKKRDELFGPHVMVRACAEGYARHASFVHPWEKELVMSIGFKNIFFGNPNHRWDILLPEHANYGTVMALLYYLCGKLQRVKPDYFSQNIEAFCTDYGPKAYGKPEKFDVIVPANR